MKPLNTCICIHFIFSILPFSPNSEITIDWQWKELLKENKDFLNFIHLVLLSSQHVSSSSWVCGMQIVFTFTEISPAERQTLSKKSDIHKEKGREPQECHRKWPDLAEDRTLWEQMNAENAHFQNSGNLAKCNFCHLTLWTNLTLWIGLIRSCCF